jgi:hypothetical protein
MPQAYLALQKTEMRPVLHLFEMEAERAGFSQFALPEMFCHGGSDLRCSTKSASSPGQKSMTNDQARMTKGFPLTQSRNQSLCLRTHGSFELRHSLVIMVSSFVIPQHP